jgi:hypothetical protein
VARDRPRSRLRLVALVAVLAAVPATGLTARGQARPVAVWRPGLRPFVRAGKAVFSVEYELDTGAFCPRARELGFMSMRKRLDLDASREPCF